MKIAAALVIALVLTAGACGKGDDKPVDTAVASSAATTVTSPAAKARTAGEIVANLKTNGLPIAETTVYTAADDPNDQLGRPGGYTSKASWHDTRVETQTDFDVTGGGSVEVFGTETDAQKRYDYVDSITHGNAMLNEYHWRHGVIFLRVSKELTPDQADGYKRALDRL
ncbi:MAG: hypothetical protein H0W70_12355 [Actinobacteria bacterium]|nr:hypothetical protein [Pseudonocardiales bacterium]MBA3654971.1 hypothetical protein [Actinomycetota bacterium]